MATNVLKHPSIHTLDAMNLKENIKEDMFNPYKINTKHYPLRYWKCKK